MKWHNNFAYILVSSSRTLNCFCCNRVNHPSCAFVFYGNSSFTAHCSHFWAIEHGKNFRIEKSIFITYVGNMDFRTTATTSMYYICSFWQSMTWFYQQTHTIFYFSTWKVVFFNISDCVQNWGFQTDLFSNRRVLP